MKKKNKKFTRDNYMISGKRNEMYNLQNQPFISDELKQIYCNFIKSKPIDDNIHSYTNYPDMDKVYDYFSSYLSFSKDTFILTNGCEEALKIAFQVIKRIGEEKNRKNIVYAEFPRWGMVDVLAKQVFGNNTILNNDYKYRDIDEYEFADWVSNSIWEKIDQPNTNAISYQTYEYNNILRHETPLNPELEPSPYPSFKYDNLSHHNSELFAIIDETYTPLSSFDKMNCLIDTTNVIIVGSLSKVCGCGLRLGYVLFNQKYSRLFNIYRPQYISQLAADLIQYDPFAKYLRSLRFNLSYKETKEYREKAEVVLSKLFKLGFGKAVKLSFVTPWYCTVLIEDKYIAYRDRRDYIFSRLGKSYQPDVADPRTLYRINWTEEEYNFIFN